MNDLLKKLYYKFNSWRYGITYGCGRCHHSVGLHKGCTGKCEKCFCHKYSINRMH